MPYSWLLRCSSRWCDRIEIYIALCSQTTERWLVQNSHLWVSRTGSCWWAPPDPEAVLSLSPRVSLSRSPFLFCCEFPALFPAYFQQTFLLIFLRSSECIFLRSSTPLPLLSSSNLLSHLKFPDFQDPWFILISISFLFLVQYIICVLLSFHSQLSLPFSSWHLFISQEQSFTSFFSIMFKRFISSCR